MAFLEDDRSSAAEAQDGGDDPEGGGAKPGLNPGLWGASTWRTLQRLARVAREQHWPRPQRRRVIDDIPHVLACPRCRGSFRRLLADSQDVQAALAALDLEDVFYQAHQWVNYKHNRRHVASEWTLDRVRGEYGELLGDAPEASWAPDVLLMFFFMFCNYPFEDDTSVGAEQQRQHLQDFFHLVVSALPSSRRGEAFAALVRDAASRELARPSSSASASVRVGSLAGATAWQSSTTLIKAWYAVYQRALATNPDLLLQVRTLATSCSVLRDDPSVLQLQSYTDIVQYLQGAL
jgi:hypothetical protein